jgi:hypothetical protein
VNVIEDVADGSAKPVQGVEDQRAAFSQAIQDVDEAGSVCGGTGLLVAIDPPAVDAGLGQGIELAVEVLLGGRDPRVSVVHGCQLPRSCNRTGLMVAHRNGTLRGVWEPLTEVGVPLGRMWDSRHDAASSDFRRYQDHIAAFTST